MSKPVCVVVGVGPGNGAACARKFSSEGYDVTLLARNQDYLKELEEQIPGSKGFAFDVTDAEGASQVFERIKAAVSSGPDKANCRIAGRNEDFEKRNCGLEVIF